MGSFLQAVRKADVPESLMRYVKGDIQAGRIKSTWTEVASWGSCKLVARKQGAVIRFAKSHYGIYTCCATEQVRMEGYALRGMKTSELPGWAFDMWCDARKFHPDLAFMSFRRQSVNLIDVTAINDQGTVARISMYKANNTWWANELPDLWWCGGMVGARAMEHEEWEIEEKMAYEEGFLETSVA